MNEGLKVLAKRLIELEDKRQMLSLQQRNSDPVKEEEQTIEYLLLEREVFVARDMFNFHADNFFKESRERVDG